MGDKHTCVVVAGGGVKCWGDNTYGQLGIGGTDQKNSPAAVNLGTGVRGVCKKIVCMQRTGSKNNYLPSPIRYNLTT
jgi:alpha-tubulin suppressor-like RCC1 family protein